MKKQRGEDWYIVYHVETGWRDGYYRNKHDAEGVRDYFEDEFPGNTFEVRASRDIGIHDCILLRAWRLRSLLSAMADGSSLRH